jgi:hypothetical protein
MRSWGSGAIPPSNGTGVGAFRFICGSSHLKYDDPIVFPGQPGVSHLHQFFGNTMADANSTYQSLRTSGMSTCGSPVNRSAYWVPAMMNGKGKVVQPDYIQVYYKRLPETHPDCFKNGALGCKELPRGLRMVFGFNMKTGTGFFGTGVTNVGSWNCVPKDNKNIAPGTKSGSYPNIIEAAKNCPMGAGGNRLELSITAPVCWDGIHLDSADHRSHLSLLYDTHMTGFACPKTHPYIIPSFHLGVFYSIDSDLYNDINVDGTWKGTQTGWHLSSDEMNNSIPGATGHADWFGAWDDTVLGLWHKGCINGQLNCSGGDTGTGLQIIGASQPYPNVYYPNVRGWSHPNRIVDPPVKPAMASSVSGSGSTVSTSQKLNQQWLCQ